MKFRTSLYAFLLSVLGLVSPVQADIIEVRADHWMPYNGDPTAERPGYVVELLRAAFPNDTINYQTCSWDQACADLAEGKIDAVIGASPEDNPSAIFPALTIGMMRTVFYIKKDSPWRFDGIPSLTSIRLATTEGYSYDDGGVLDTYLQKSSSPAVQATEGDSPTETNITKLRAGEVDVMIEDASVMLWMLKRLKIPNGEVRSGGALSQKNLPLYVAFSPKKSASPARAEQFTASLSQQRETGALAILLALYDLDDWQS